MRFQKRDGEILREIHLNDGVLAYRHIHQTFWPGKSWRAMERRLSKLFHSEYINRPSRLDYKTKPIPEPICYLDWRGALFVAGICGVEVKPPSVIDETRLREFKTRLKRKDFRWVREPRWSLLQHDIAVVDFKLAVQNDIDGVPRFSLKNWLPESIFRSNMDIVVYKAKRRNGEFTRKKKGVIPDAYFEFVDRKRRERGDASQMGFLIELDMSTHDNNRFGREKIIPGYVYLKSKTYINRFGHNNGRWLVVTNGGSVRLKNLMQQTWKNLKEKGDLFFFTSLKNVKSKNVLFDPIWFRGGEEQPCLRPLLPSPNRNDYGEKNSLV